MKPAIILKLDDVTHEGTDGRHPVSDRWQRCVDLLAERGVKSALGVIGYSLEEEHVAYFDWIKALHATGLIEFWNHGHWRRTQRDTIGEFEKSLQDQQASLKRTQALGREKLGIEFKVFGVHWSGFNESTEVAMASVPEIKIWLNGPAGLRSGPTILTGAIALEQPIFCPNFDAVTGEYEERGEKLPYLLLQGHPAGWDEARFDQFTRIVEFLRAKQCLFMTPSEYVASSVGAASVQ
jgi:peptidoglycan/xylan/chitin deacetylase (PgdA/CDA1 family)